MLPQIVHFDFGDEEINSMDMVSASCTVNKGDLPVDIYWKRDGHKIFTNDGISISRTNKRMSVLSIESVRDRHSGEYTCVVENAAGVVQHSAILSVNGIVRHKLRFRVLLSSPSPTSSNVGHSMPFFYSTSINA